MKDTSKLVRKVITNKAGKRQTVYVREGERPESGKPKASLFEALSSALRSRGVNVPADKLRQAYPGASNAKELLERVVRHAAERSKLEHPGRSRGTSLGTSSVRLSPKAESVLIEELTRASGLSGPAAEMYLSVARKIRGGAEKFPLMKRDPSSPVGTLRPEDAAAIATVKVNVDPATISSVDAGEPYRFRGYTIERRGRYVLVHMPDGQTAHMPGVLPESIHNAFRFVKWQLKPESAGTREVPGARVRSEGKSVVSRDEISRAFDNFEDLPTRMAENPRRVIGGASVEYRRHIPDAGAKKSPGYVVRSGGRVLNRVEPKSGKAVLVPREKAEEMVWLANKGMYDIAGKPEGKAAVSEASSFGSLSEDEKSALGKALTSGAVWTSGTGVEDLKRTFSERAVRAKLSYKVTAEVERRIDDVTAKLWSSDAGEDLRKDALASGKRVYSEPTVAVVSAYMRAFAKDLAASHESLFDVAVKGVRDAITSKRVGTASESAHNPKKLVKGKPL